MGKVLLMIMLIMACAVGPSVYADGTLDAISAQMDALMKDQANQMNALRTAYENNEMTQAEYDAKVTENTKVFQEQISALEGRFHSAAMGSAPAAKQSQEDTGDAEVAPAL